MPMSSLNSNDLQSRSQSSRVAFGCGGTGDLHYRCAADKSAETA